MTLTIHLYNGQILQKTAYSQNVLMLSFIHHLNYKVQTSRCRRQTSRLSIFLKYFSRYHTFKEPHTVQRLLDAINPLKTQNLLSHKFGWERWGPMSHCNQQNIPKQWNKCNLTNDNTFQYYVLLFLLLY